MRRFRQEYYIQSVFGEKEHRKNLSRNLLCSGKCVIFLVDDNHVDNQRDDEHMIITMGAHKNIV